jgi:archaeosine synthase
MKTIYHTLKRDGPSRIGEFKINNKKILSPNIIYINNSRFKSPNFADIQISNDDTNNNKPTFKLEYNLPYNTKNQKIDKMNISNPSFYPYDISKIFHKSTIKEYNKKNELCQIIPSNKELIDNNIKNNSSILIINNSYQLFNKQKEFVDYIIKLREKIGYEKIIYLPTIGNPTNYALFSLLGIDFFDSTHAIISARNKELLFPTGKYNIDNIIEIPCSCPICKKINDEPSEMNFEQILNHNYYSMYNEIKLVRNSIAIGNIRELVESRVRSNPHLTAILKYFDLNHFEYIENRTPVIKKNKLLATTSDSLNRVEITRFKKRLIHRYYKPKNSKILLLLPCSSKKPYSFSKSHKKFLDVLSSIKNRNIIHEVIITSPMGIVPRELELIYPASTYDIPVIGNWEENEKIMIKNLFIEYLKNNKYEKIIVHLQNNIIEIIKDIIKEPIMTVIDNNPYSKESLKKLTLTLNKETKKFNLIKKSVRIKENIESIASYQFGKKIAKKLIKDCEIKGKYPYQRILYEKAQLGMLTKDRGYISLTLNGAEKILSLKEYQVEIYNDFKLKGSVFAPGIKNADKKIRIGDEVIIIQNNKINSVGVAQMNGIEMIESNYGEAIKVRHKI